MFGLYYRPFRFVFLLRTEDPDKFIGDALQPGEKPYRVVNGRPNNRASLEFRLPKTVDLYGRWQTEPYVTPKIMNVRTLSELSICTFLL